MSNLFFELSSPYLAGDYTARFVKKNVAPKVDRFAFFFDELDKMGADNFPRMHIFDILTLAISLSEHIDYLASQDARTARRVLYVIEEFLPVHMVSHIGRS